MKTELTKDIVVKILIKAQKIYRNEKNLQDAFNDVFDILTPGSYPPVIETDALLSFCEGLDMVFPGLHEDISYFIYEAPGLKSAQCTIPGDKRKYDAKKIEDYAEFILNLRK